MKRYTWHILDNADPHWQGGVWENDTGLYIVILSLDINAIIGLGTPRIVTVADEKGRTYDGLGFTGSSAFGFSNPMLLVPKGKIQSGAINGLLVYCRSLEDALKFWQKG